MPGGVLTGEHIFTNDRRLDIPSTIVACSFPSAEFKKGLETEGWTWLAGVPELRDLTWIDLPTSHWPMWSKPRELARILGDIADKVDTGQRAAGARPTKPDATRAL